MEIMAPSNSVAELIKKTLKLRLPECDEFIPQNILFMLILCRELQFDFYL